MQSTRNTHQFDEHDFDLLEILLGRQSVLLLPNVVTEASNLLRQHKPPERNDVCRTLQRLVEIGHEIYIASANACEQPDYVNLGLTDAALLLATRNDVLLTADARLYLTAERRGIRAVNFNHERERYGLV